jgi:hypothetical protein
MGRFDSKRLPLAALILLVATIGFAIQGSGKATDYVSLKAEAEKLVGEGSWARAWDLYRTVDQAPLPPFEKRWVAFRLADTRWRAQSGARTADQTVFEEARQALEPLADPQAREEDRDLVWAEACESLADFHWTRIEHYRDWQAQAWYRRALDWWAASTDLAAAAPRWRHLFLTVVNPAEGEDYGSGLGMLTEADLDGFVRLAASPAERSLGRYLEALRLVRQGAVPGNHRRTREAFEAALSGGAAERWTDDTLFAYAEWLGSRVIYRRLLSSYRKGESRWSAEAERRIREITSPDLDVTTSEVFLPGSDTAFRLGWRNLGRISFTLTRVDLPSDVRLRDGDGFSDPARLVSAAGRTPLRSWSRDTGDTGEHLPGSESVWLDGPLPAGAYVLDAKGDGAESRALVLVSDLAVVVKASGSRHLAFVTDALSGAPVPGARVTLWRWRDPGRQAWESASAVADRDGLAEFTRERIPASGSWLVLASDGDRQAFATGWGNQAPSGDGEPRVLVFADRAACRPGETIHWKMIARRRTADGYATPAGEKVAFEILDPRGTKVGGGTVTLNAFGSAWGSFETNSSMALGEYRLRTIQAGNQTEENLFRLEEYKLPEYKVTVSTPEEKGKPKVFRPGETVSALVRVEYYSGGPVTGAAVEAILRQSPFNPDPRPVPLHAWFGRPGGEEPHQGGGRTAP